MEMPPGVGVTPQRFWGRAVLLVRLGRGPPRRRGGRGSRRVLLRDPVAPRTRRGPLARRRGFICLKLLTARSGSAGGEEVLGKGLRGPRHP